MFKKGFAILVFLLTTIILMAHAVIPHHHHNNEICIVNPETSSENEKHNHADCDGNDEHGTTEDDLSCILQKIIIYRSDNSDQESKLLKSPDYITVDFNTTILISINNTDFHLPKLYRKCESPLYIGSNSNLVSLHKGLRAPPIV